MTIGQGQFTQIQSAHLAWTLDMQLKIINIMDGSLDLVLDSDTAATLTVTYTDAATKKPMTDVVNPAHYAAGSTVYFAGTPPLDLPCPICPRNWPT